MQKYWGYKMDLIDYFGSKMPLILLISPCTVQEFPITGKKIPITETEAAHIDPNRQKLTKIGYARNAKVAGTDVLEGLIFSLLDWK